MCITGEPEEIIAALQDLLDELDSPDLTLPQATVLRQRLYDLLEVVSEPPQVPGQADESDSGRSPD